MLNAFHGNIWFDESYSVGIAAFDFPDIWNIGSYDVHPVLYYCALHILYLIFGTNILVYRIFTILGAVALAALGLTHLRKDFGPLVGILFTFLVFFTPYVAFMSVEIRMYSWVTFTVMVCAIYAFRIGKRALKSQDKIPVHWWFCFGIASLASAYLQYFGTVSVFIINVFLLVSLIAAKKPKLVGIFFLQACLQVLAYLPWLMVLFGQMGVVSNTYWAEFKFPDTIRELISYPVTTLQVTFSAWFFDHGLVVKVVLIILLVLLIVASVAVAVSAIKLIRRRKTIKGTPLVPGLFGLAVYLGLIGLGMIASIAMGSYIMYYRYAFVCIGPFLFFLACVLAYVITLGKPLGSAEQGAEGSVEGSAEDVVILDEETSCENVVSGNAKCSTEGEETSGESVILREAIISDEAATDENKTSDEKEPTGGEIISAKESLRFRIFAVAACGILLVVAVIAQGLSMVDDYSEQNEAPLTYFAEQYVAVCAYQEDLADELYGDSSISQENEESANLSANQSSEQSVEEPSVQPLVLSSDIGIQGVLAVQFPEIKQTYLDWQKGNWAKAYQAYGENFESVKSYNDLLDNYNGMFIMVGQSKKLGTPKDIADIEKRDDVELVDSEVFWRPYERTFFTVATFKISR